MRSTLRIRTYWGMQPFFMEINKFLHFKSYIKLGKYFVKWVGIFSTSVCSGFDRAILKKTVRVPVRFFISIFFQENFGSIFQNIQSSI